jgi:hypothetical protein
MTSAAYLRVLPEVIKVSRYEGAVAAKRRPLDREKETVLSFGSSSS